jgi:hypothetical protein
VVVVVVVVVVEMVVVVVVIVVVVAVVVMVVVVVGWVDVGEVLVVVGVCWPVPAGCTMRLAAAAAPTMAVINTTATSTASLVPFMIRRPTSASASY